MTLVERVAALYRRHLRAEDAGLTRDSHLPPELRLQPAQVPEGTDLAIWTWEAENLLYGIAFAGKCEKPLWFYSFRNPEQRQSQIDQTVARRKVLIEYKQRWAQQVGSH